MLSANQTPDDAAPRKATLYCPTCGHESLLDGDWQLQVHDDCTDFDCPECDTTITSRPSLDPMPDDGEGRRCYSLPA